MPDHVTALIGTYTSGDSEGIYSITMDPSTGELGRPQLAAKAKNPSFLAVAPSGQFVYAVGETSGSEGQATGSVSAYTICEGTRRLELLNRRSSGSCGALPHIA